MADPVADIRARWAAATPGPYRLEGAKWAQSGELDETISGALVATCGWIGSVQGRCTKATALALAAAPDDVARLLAEVDRLRGAPPVDAPPLFQWLAARGGAR